MECLATDENVFNLVPSGESQLYPNANTDTETAKVASPNSYENSLKVFLAQKIYEVDEVEHVYCRRENNVFFVWIVVDQHDYEVRKEIYKKQKETIRLFDSEMFDFYIVARKGKSPDSIVSGVEEIPRRDPSKG